MKKLIVIVCLLIPYLAVAQEEQANESPVLVHGAHVTLSNNSIDFGDIYQGDTVSSIVEIHSNGNIPLIISNVLSTCGCTVANVPNTPILPGNVYSRRVKFDSNGKMGKQNKVVTIVSNAEEGSVYIKLVVNVMPKN